MGKHIVKTITLMLGFIVTSALLFSLFLSQQAGISAALGGIVCLISSAYFISKMTRYSGRWEAKKILMSFYRAQVIKSLLIVSLFLLIFKTFSEQISLVPFIVTFVAAHIFASIMAGQKLEEGSVSA